MEAEEGEALNTSILTTAPSARCFPPSANSKAPRLVAVFPIIVLGDRPKLGPPVELTRALTKAEMEREWPARQEGFGEMGRSLQFSATVHLVSQLAVKSLGF